MKSNKDKDSGIAPQKFGPLDKIELFESNLTVAGIPHCSLVVTRLDAKLEDNGENVELRKVEAASVDDRLGRVDHLLRQVGDLHHKGYHARDESQGPWLLTEEIGKLRPDILFCHVNCSYVNGKFSQVKQYW